ncbi:MAG TPA: retropepsin-like aspartic protease [Bacteroidia bacterium]|nr:retropepsin-like aspartic protease [Bacteroidia bacterium]
MKLHMGKKKKFVTKLRLIKIDKHGCHLAVTGKIKNKNMNLIIDTGASQTVFDKNRIAKFIGHDEFEKVESLSSGLGTNSMESHLVSIPGFSIGDLKFPNEKMMLLDLSHVNETYSIMKMKPIDGVLGGDILKAYKAVIDYEKKTITFRI